MNPLLCMLLALPVLAQYTYPTHDFTYPSDVNYFNVKSSPYNCFGDGTHDDTACIKAAIKAALTNTVSGGGFACSGAPNANGSANMNP